MPEPSFQPTPTLTGVRVRLRPLGPQDVDDLLADLADPELLRLTGTHTRFTREQIERHCATRDDQPDRLDFAVTDRHSGAYLGDLSINGLDRDNLSCGFRIALRTAVAGHGYGTEATALVVEHLFRIGLHRIELEVYAFNPRARHVYEKVGFRHEGTQREALRWDGQWVDAHVMSILATDHVSGA